ncbi:MAG: DinB family protein [Pirellulaceae bacterium]|nr:DinB family protein [Pirellulaceae bacterium]
MSATETLIQTLEFFRPRTLGVLEKIEKEPDPQGVLGWRPGPGRAHIGWQFMHLAMTEELFATERLAPHKQGAFTELWPRFRGGSTPDENIPTLDEIRRILDQSRQHLLETLSTFKDIHLGHIPEALKERKLTLLDVLHILPWHEAHHQGQAHITLNLYKAAHG